MKTVSWLVSLSEHSLMLIHNKNLDLLDLNVLRDCLSLVEVCTLPVFIY